MRNPLQSGLSAILFSRNVDPHSSRPTAGLVALLTRTATIEDIDCFKDTSVIMALNYLRR